jgi:hypothetical protein
MDLSPDGACAGAHPQHDAAKIAMFGLMIVRQFVVMLLLSF